jgi:hypothetical protein
MPNWALAKREHKRFVNYCLSSTMHIIFCLRAREKVKMVEVVGGKTEVVPIGIQPVAEKNLVFEALVSLRVEEETHHAVPLKVPEPLVSLFPKEALITKEHGQRIREWNNTGSVLDPVEQLKKRAHAVAEDGLGAYKEFYRALTSGEKKFLRETTHEENKFVAEQADAARAEEPAEDSTDAGQPVPDELQQLREKQQGMK